MIVREKLVIKFNLHIFIGYLDDKNIFNSEIIIRCSNENESVSLFNELKTKAVKDIIELTKRLEPNLSSIGNISIQSPDTPGLLISLLFIPFTSILILNL